MTDAEEEWRDVVGWEDRYQVSSYGNIRAKARMSTIPRKGGGLMPKLLKQRQMLPFINRYGYYVITFKKPTVRHNYLISRLVAIAFLENPYNLPVVHHKDSNPLNNMISNLEWTTTRQNLMYSEKTARVLTEDNVREMRGLRKTGMKVKDIGAIFGVAGNTASNAINGVNWAHVA